MNPPTNIIYLESYVESTVSLPPELQRFLNLIKSLDERCEALQDTMARNVERCIQLPPQGIRKSAADYPAEYTSLMKTINDDQAMLQQLAEEKVQVAHQALDLLEMHSAELNRMLEAFEAEYAATNPMPTSLDPSDFFSGLEAPFGAPGMGGGGGGGSKRPKQPHDNWEAQFDLGQLPGMPPPKRSHKRREDRDRDHKRKQVPQFQEEFEFLPEIPERRLLNTIPPGLRPSSQQLQRSGHILQHGDITPDLRGRLAEVWWPDDNMWYLIEIQGVNMHDLTADIMYVTGETEVLELKDIVKDQHMSLIDI